MLPDGRGAGRAESGTVMRVAGAVPGDVVRVEDQQRVTPSADRRAPPCPWDAQCGGCDLSVLEPAARRTALARSVAHAFRTERVPQVIASPRESGHRARIKLAIGDQEVGYRPPRSHDIVPVAACLSARPEVQQAHARLRDWLENNDAGRLSAVEIRSDGTRAVYAFTGSAPGLESLGDVATDGRRIAGQPTLTLTVDGHALRVGPRSFYQVNLEINELLVRHVRSILVEHGAEAALDLYAGVGNLSLPIARTGIPVVAVEAPGPGGDDLKYNARQVAGLTAVSRRVEKLDPSRHVYDCAVLDPPRAGAPGILPRLALTRPRVIVYVSCHAPSAARDIARLSGYRLSGLTCFDMFPDTHHIETVAVLERA